MAVGKLTVSPGKFGCNRGHVEILGFNKRPIRLETIRGFPSAGYEGTVDKDVAYAE